MSEKRLARREAWLRAARMPFWWIRKWVRPLKSFRAPARISIAALCCWSVCAALGLAQVLAGAREQSPQPARAHTRRLHAPPQVLAALCALIILFECWRTPMPLFDAREPRWAHVLRQARGAGGVVQLPIAFNDWRTSWAMWGQTIHRRPLWNAYLSRGPRLPRDPVRDSVLWRALGGHSTSGDPLELLTMEALPSPQQAALDLGLWRSRGVRFLLWQRHSTRPEDEARARRLFARSGRARLLSEEPGALLWEITQTSTRASRASHELRPLNSSRPRSAPQQLRARARR